MDGIPRSRAWKAADVSGFVVETAVISSDKAASRILGSRWSKNLPMTSPLNTSVDLALSAKSLGSERPSVKS
jgi:hypothetical protein